MRICSPKVAVIYDTENRWALEDAAGPRNAGACFTKKPWKNHTSAFRRLGLDVDVIDETQRPLRTISIVAAPDGLSAAGRMGGKGTARLWPDGGTLPG